MHASCELLILQIIHGAKPKRGSGIYERFYIIKELNKDVASRKTHEK